LESERNIATIVDRIARFNLDEARYGISMEKYGNWGELTLSKRVDGAVDRRKLSDSMLRVLPVVPLAYGEHVAKGKPDFRLDVQERGEGSVQVKARSPAFALFDDIPFEHCTDLLEYHTMMRGIYRSFEKIGWGLIPGGSEPLPADGMQEAGEARADPLRRLEVVEHKSRILHAVRAKVLRIFNSLVN